MTQTNSPAPESLMLADMDWPACEAEITRALAERDPGEAWVTVFDCQFQLFEAIHREQDMALCRLLALTCEAEHRVHACVRDDEPEPPVATLDVIEEAAAADDHSGVLGAAFGWWLHVWRCAVRRGDYDTLARLASMWLAHARYYPPAQFVLATPPLF